MHAWSLDELLAALQDTSKPFPAAGLYRLSDLPPEEAKAIAAIWPKLPLARRRALVEDMQSFLDYSDRFSFVEMGLIALNDEDPYVRQRAIELLWGEADERLIPHLVRVLREDPDTRVRAQAAAALGEYVYLGEVEEISPRRYQEVAEALRAVLTDETEPLEVRRRALEAYSFASDPDVARWIEAFYQRGTQDDDEESLLSALFAMGRSADPRWTRYVVLHLHDRRPKVRAEAATAAGRLEMKRVIPDLLELLEDADRDVRMAAAWALSELGGGEDEVERALQRALQHAEDVNDEEEMQVLAEALDNLAFNTSLVTAQLDLLDLLLDGADLIDDVTLDLPDEYYRTQRTSHSGFEGTNGASHKSNSKSSKPKS
ncbi:MAG: HEAT repeat domain-containing protein [Chloroflexi bacterium]|nr:HEAT repeat domain-containing protein [Chloroflexota bacterium]